MSNKYDEYTLWVKFRTTGWVALITAKKAGRGWLSPYSFLLNYAKRVYTNLEYYQQGKTWMIKPAGQMPAGAVRERDA